MLVSVHRSIHTHHESIVGERGIDFGLLRQVVFQDLDVLDEAERLEHVGLYLLAESSFSVRRTSGGTMA